MNFDYNGNLTFEERVGLVTRELIKYGLDKDSALRVAALEEPITNFNKYEYLYKRFSNILKICEHDEKIKNKVIVDIFKSYKKGNKKIDKYIYDLSIYINYGTDLPLFE